MKQTKFILTLAFILAAQTFLASCKRGEFIEQIGSAKVYTKDYEDYYATYIEKASRFSNAEKKTIYKLMCNPDLIPPNSGLHALLVKFNPEVNYDEFRNMKIIEQAARQEGFLNRPVVQDIIKQVTLETIVSLYMQEKMYEKIKLTEEQKKSKCEELRREAGPQFAALPLETCMFIAEGILKDQSMRSNGRFVQEEIKESVTIKKNNDFKRKDYFENGIDLYKTIRKEGGCRSDLPQSTSPLDNTRGMTGTNR